MSRKVLLIVIDALSSWVVRPALEKGKLPAMRRLIDAGQAQWECTSIFPSLTPAATSSICTGRYPAEHGIFGMYYFDRDDGDRVHFFGTDTWTILNKRFRNFFDDFLRSLNHDLLKSETIFERLEDRGVTCACLNYLIFRGRHSYKASTPWLLQLWPGIPHAVTLNGPAVFCLGDFISARRDRPVESPLAAPGGIFNRYGFTDNATGQQLLQLIQQGLPDFTLAYFPDNDFESHSRGPEQALGTLERVDELLSQVMAVAGGLDRLLSDTTVLITGDHSQSVLDSEGCGIDLRDALADFNLVDAGTPWSGRDELMICPNLRAAQIYLRRGSQLEQQEIVERILPELRVDQVITREPTFDDEYSYVVSTADRGRLEFWPAGPGKGQATDDFGGRWAFRGSLATIDAEVNQSGEIQYHDYPNALERIAQSFEERYSGDLWITARLGREFCSTGSVPHNRGSHGSLHRLDSTAPLIMAGVPSDLLPAVGPLRIVDILPLCLSLLGETPATAVGQSRVSPWPSSTAAR